MVVRRTLATLCALVLTLGRAATALGAEQRVFDEAALLTSTEVQSIEAKIDAMRAQYNTDVIVLTTEDTNGKATNLYCADYFEAMGFGMNDTQDGVLLCIDMDNRQIMMVTHGATIPIVNDQEEESVYDAMYSYVSDGDYGQAFLAGLDEVETCLAAGPDHGQFTYDRATGEITGFAYPEEAQTILQNGINEGYMAYDEATGKYYYYPNGLPAPGLFTWERLKKVLSPVYFALSAGVGAVCGLLARGGVKKGYNKPFAAVSYAFREKSSVDMPLSTSNLVNKYVTTRLIPRNTDDGGGRGGFGGGGFSGGSGTFSSSSGGSFGGGGGRGF